MQPIKAAILGAGELPSSDALKDLIIKIKDQAQNLELLLAAADSPESVVLQMAAELGVATSQEGLPAVCADADIRIVFVCGDGESGRMLTPQLHKAGKTVVDLTMAAGGVGVVPALLEDEDELSETIHPATYAAQATIPMVAAVARITPVSYAEVVVTTSSSMAGPEARANIDDLILGTKQELQELGNAARTKAILLLNPATPPISMRATIYCHVDAQAAGKELESIRASVDRMVERVREYAPGYSLHLVPMLDNDRLTLMVTVMAQESCLPEYAGSLDIVNAAALRTADHVAHRMQLVHAA